MQPNLSSATEGQKDQAMVSQKIRILSQMEFLKHTLIADV